MQVTYQLVPLDQLSISSLNARFGRAVATEDLETSIAAAGRLVTPLSCYPQLQDGSGGWLVWDGGRRLLALQALAKAKKLPAGLKAGIPCLCYPDQHHQTIGVDSLATFVREGMSAGDEFLAIRALTERGLSITETAAALNLRTARVGQLQRLVNLAPEVLDAFTGGKIPLDVAEAFTLSEDHDRQREVLKAFNPKRDNGWGVRQSFRKATVPAGDRWCEFVGRNAYAEAGGGFLNDLFSGGNVGEDWTSPELVTRLAKQKLADLKAKVEAEGWQWVEAHESAQVYGWDKDFDQLPGKKDTFTLEQKATAGAMIWVNYQGNSFIERGLVRKAKGKAKTEEGQKAQEDPAMYGWGHGGHELLTQVATAAVQVAIGTQPDAAYDAILTTMAWTTFRESGRAAYGQFTDEGGKASLEDTHNSNAPSLRVDERGYGFIEVGVAGMDELSAMAKGWAAKLPHERVAFCDYVAWLTPDEKAELLAISFAWTLNGVEGGFHRYQRHPVRLKHLGWIGRHAGVDINAAWTPDADFLKKGSKDALLLANTDMGGADGMQGAKKGELVSYVAGLAQRKRWVPKLLADLFAPPAKPAAPKAEKPAKGAKRMFKDALGDQIAALASDDAGEAATVAQAGEAPQG